MSDVDEDNREAEFHYAVFAAISHLSPPFLQNVKNKIEVVLSRSDFKISDIKNAMSSSEADLVKAMCGFRVQNQPPKRVFEYMQINSQDSVEDPLDDDSTRVSRIVEDVPAQEADFPIKEDLENVDDVTVEDGHVENVDDVTVEDGHVYIADNKAKDETVDDVSMAGGETVQVVDQMDDEVFEDDKDDLDHAVPLESFRLILRDGVEDRHDDVADDSAIDPSLLRQPESEPSVSSTELVLPPVVSEPEQEESIHQVEEEETQNVEEGVSQSEEQVVEVENQVEDKAEHTTAGEEQSSEENSPIKVVVEVSPSVLDDSTDSGHVASRPEEPSPACQPLPDQPLPVATVPIGEQPTPVEDVVPTAKVSASAPGLLPPIQPLQRPVVPAAFSTFGGRANGIPQAASFPVTHRHFNFAKIGDIPAAWDPILAVADFHTVYISQAENPTDFYVATYYEEGRNDVAAMMLGWWNSEKNNPEITLKAAAIVPGLPVSVVTTPSVIERGVVVSTDHDNATAKIRFIDKGSVESVNCTRLYHITKHQMSDQFPAQAIRCTVDLGVHTFEDGSSSWPPQVMHSLRRAVETKTQYTAVFGGERDRKTIVNLYIPRYGYEEKKSLLAHVCKYLAIAQRRRHSLTGSYVSVFGETSSETSHSEVNSTLDTDLDDEGDSDGTLLDVDIDLDNEIVGEDSTA